MKKLKIRIKPIHLIHLVKTVIYIFCLNFLFTSSLLASALPSTQVQFYRPFEDNVAGQITPVSTQTLKGECHQHSKIDNRSDAWQCKIEDHAKILDPCFIKTYVKTKTAICPVSPWQSQSVIIDFKNQLIPPKNNTNIQNSLDMSRDDPWAIRLMDGTQCIKTPVSSTFLVHGQEIKYTCTNGSFLLGHIQRCELIWKMLFLPSQKSHTLNMVEISMVWY